MAVTSGNRSTPVRLLPILGLLAACVACAADQPSITTAEESPTLYTHDVRGRGDDADINGELRYLPGPDCFVLEIESVPVPEATHGSDPGSVEPAVLRYVSVWPPGARVWQQDGEVVGVEVPDVGTIGLGERVTGGGGYANPETSDLDLPRVPSECLAGGGEFAFLHSVSSG